MKLNSHLRICDFQFVMADEYMTNLIKVNCVVISYILASFQSQDLEKLIMSHSTSPLSLGTTRICTWGHKSQL